MGQRNNEGTRVKAQRPGPNSAVAKPPARRGRRAQRTSPDAGSRPAPAGHLRRDTGAPASPQIRLLCVDDHTVLVEGLKAQFAIKAGIEVVGRLATAARLVDEVRRLRPSAVLLDIEMP